VGIVYLDIFRSRDGSFLSRTTHRTGRSSLSPLGTVPVRAVQPQVSPFPEPRAGAADEFIGLGRSHNRSHAELPSCGADMPGVLRSAAAATPRSAVSRTVRIRVLRAPSGVETAHRSGPFAGSRVAWGPGVQLARSTGVISTAAIAGTASSLRRSRPTLAVKSAPSTGTTWASTSSCLGPM
jgi:hypothetical protein